MTNGHSTIYKIKMFKAVCITWKIETNKNVAIFQGA